MSGSLQPEGTATAAIDGAGGQRGGPEAATTAKPRRTYFHPLRTHLLQQGLPMQALLVQALFGARTTVYSDGGSLGGAARAIAVVKR